MVIIVMVQMDEIINCSQNMIQVGVICQVSCYDGADGRMNKLFSKYALGRSDLTRGSTGYSRRAGPNFKNNK